MKLDECLMEYRALTLDIMEKVNEDGIIEYLFNERQYILDEIRKLSFSKEEINRMVESLNIIQLDTELNLLMKKEKVNTRRKMENLKKMKNANMQYMSIGYVPSKFTKEM